MSQSEASTAAPFAHIRKVAATAPLGWVARGWRDLMTGPGLFYGIAFVAMGWSLQVYLADQAHVTLALGTGFALIGPFLALGLYDLSHQRERGGAADLLPSLHAWRRHPGAIGLYAVILLLLLAGWMRVSVVLVALFYQGTMPTATTFLKSLVFSGENLGFLAVYFGVGAGFALLVFAVSVVSIPMMLDRGTDTITAMIASCLALARNPAAMAVWAALIGVLILAGLATWYFALLVTGPLVGHATWHAYRDLVAGGPGPASAPS
jgi:uncharacterized membrane protein